MGLAVDLFQERIRLGHARDFLANASPEVQARIMREAELAYLRDPSGVIGSRRRTRIVHGWTELLLEATEKVEQDQEDAKDYAAVALERTDDDRAWTEAAANPAAWKDA